MQKNIKYSLILVALLSSLQANETKEVELKPLTITSTAIDTDELKSTDAVEVYTAQDIEKAHVQNVYEFLNQQTSVISMPTFGNPFSQKLDMHGYGIGDGYQNIVIKVNGRKINNIDMVPALLSGISLSSISRIEIIKSSGIVTGGDGSNAGVINITTKRDNDNAFSMYLGSYGAFDTSIQLGHSDDKLSVNFNAEMQKNDGTRYLADNEEKDENSLAIANIDIAYTPISELELRFGAGLANTDVDYAGSLSLFEFNTQATQAGTSYTTQSYNTKNINSGISYFINDALTLNLDISREIKESNSEWISPLYSSKWGADYEYESFNANLEYESDLLDVVVGTDGFSGLRESHKTAFASANETKKENIAAYIMTQLHLGNSSFKAGYRYEDVSYDYKDTTKNNSAKHKLDGAELGYNYMIDKEKSVFVNYSHSFQAPDIDRFFVGGTFNSFIEPMKADSYTLGFNYILPKNKFKISAYYIELKNEIYYYKDSVSSWPAPSLSVNTNIDKSHKYGIDIYDKVIFNESFNLALNYNYVEAIIDDEFGRNGENYANKDLPGVSNHNAKATLSYLPNSNTTLALTQIYRSKAYAANDFNNDFTQKQKAYNSTDISIAYTEETWEVFAKINNLFNQKNGLWIRDDAIYPVNFTTTAMAGFKLKF